MLTAIEAAAIRVVARQVEDAAKGLSPGKGQEVDVVLHVKGFLNKGADGTSIRQQKPKGEDILAWMLSQFSREARDRLVDAFVESVQAGGGVVPDAPEEASEAAKLCVLAATKTVHYPRTGAVTGAVNLSVVDTSSLTRTVARSIETASRMITFDVAQEEVV